jgi:hypothetical protein
MEVRKLAERTGFEPAVACATTVFKTVTFNHSVTSPDGKRPEVRVISGNNKLLYSEFREVSIVQGLFP